MKLSIFKERLSFSSIYNVQKLQCPTMSGKISMLKPSLVCQESTFMIFHATFCENLRYVHFYETFIKQNPVQVKKIVKSLMFQMKQTHDIKSQK